MGQTASIRQPETMGRTDLPALFNSWDFDHDEDKTEFTITALGGGSAANLAGVPNGVLRTTGAAGTASSGVNIQLESTPVRLDSSGSWAAMEVRFRLGDVKEALFVGFSDQNAALLTALTDAIGIQKSAGAAGQWTFRHVRSTNGSNVVRNIGALVSDTGWHVLTLYVDASTESVLGGGNVRVAVDGVFVGDFDLKSSVPYDDNLTPSIAIASGDAVGTQVADIDYLSYKSSRSRL